MAARVLNYLIPNGSPHGLTKFTKGSWKLAPFFLRKRAWDDLTYEGL